MRCLLIILLINLLGHGYVIKAQTFHPVDKWVEYIEVLSNEVEDPERIETLYTQLSYLAEHPMDINIIPAEELKKLPFISDQQVEDIIAYRSRYGKMLTIYELKNIESLDIQSIELILPFIYVSEYREEKKKLTRTNLLKHGKHELLLRYDQCLQTKSGYQDVTASGEKQPLNKRYLGESFYHSLRYSYNFDERLQVGVIGEKDAGEPFLNKHHKGYDFYSAHFVLKGEGILKNLVVGDYKTSFAQGLVLSHDFTPGRSAVMTQTERRSNGFRRHYSTNEQDFFRGTAATLNFDKVDINLFYSYRKMDALPDSNSFSSIKTDGLHRLPPDRLRRKKLPMHTWGGNVRYASSSFTFGATFVYYSFGKYEWLPETKPYNIHSFRGTDNYNWGVDYSWRIRGLKIFGETALSKNGALATLNGLLLTPTSYISLLALHRYYDKKYQAYYGNAFGQRSDVHNEQGLYLGLQFIPVSRWKISGYADLFRHPWLLYNVDAPSSGKEYMGQIDYSNGSEFSFYIRYRYRQKERNETEAGIPVVAIHPYSQHKMRMQFVYGLSNTILCRSSFVGIISPEGRSTDTSQGIMLSQSMGWKPSGVPIEADLYFAWFDTDNYNSRISSYEKSILYAFNMPSFYGEGIRLAATFRWKIVDRLSFSAKIGHVHYYDRDITGTGTEAIAGRNKTDIYSILNWKF